MTRAGGGRNCLLAQQLVGHAECAIGALGAPVACEQLEVVLQCGQGDQPVVGRSAADTGFGQLHGRFCVSARVERGVCRWQSCVEECGCVGARQATGGGNLVRTL